MAEQSAARQRARALELCHLSLDRARLPAGVVQRCRHRLRHHHDGVADRSRHCAPADGFSSPLRQCVVFDLHPPDAPLAAVAMGADRARLIYSVVADVARARHPARRNLPRRVRQLSVGFAEALGGGAVVQRGAGARGAHGMDARVRRDLFLAPHQGRVPRLAALFVCLRLAAADAGAGRLRRSRQRSVARKPGSRICCAGRAACQGERGKAR